MKCKFCKAEMEQGSIICPNCGAVNMEKKKGEKKQSLPVWAIVVISVLTAAVVALGAFLIVTEVMEQNPFKNYTGSDKALVANANKVVATVGDVELTNAELQIYYWVYVYSFMDENSYYLSSMGFDYTKPFHKQECSVEKGKSWQEYFLKQALETWYQYAVLVMAGEEAKFELPEDEVEYLNNLRTTFNEKAVEYGYKDAEDMLLNEMGAGATFDAYIDYTVETFKGMGYYNFLCENLELTDAEISKYYDDNKAYFEGYDIKKDDSVFACVTVRHILVIPTGGKKDDNGNTTYSDTEWDACRVKAQALLDKFLAGTVTEEAFAELAKANTEDSRSKENGGLIAQFFKGEMVKEFEEWSFSKDRKAGDTGLVKTVYGYHIMYFVEPHIAWYYYADAEMRYKEGEAKLAEFKKKWTMEVKWNDLLVGHIQLGK